MAEPVLTEVSDGVGVVTINRPEARNAVNGAVARGIAAAVDELDGRADVSVLVLTGAGGTFCAGMDLKGFLAGDAPVVEGRGFGGIVEQPPAKPVIAAVEGYALAGGFELALACDLVVASETARFGLPEVRRGLVAAAGGLLRLPRRIPYHLAMEIALTGEHYPAAAAGTRPAWSTSSCRQGEALASASDWPGGWRSAPRWPWRRPSGSSRRPPTGPAARPSPARREIINPVFGSADAMEGALAFAEKRPPRLARRVRP